MDRKEKFIIQTIKIFKGKVSNKKGKVGIISEDQKIKRRKTMELKGHWIKIEDLNERELYRKLVSIHTNNSIIKKYSKEELKNRGKFKNKGYNQIDHIFSIHEGFKLGIIPKIIGSKSNIRFISTEKNWSKQRKCDISLEELFKKYDEEIKEENE
jgi:hypothetical protein